MKSKPFGALFGLLALVAILGVAPAFGQTTNEVSGMIMLSAKASDGTTVTINTDDPTSGQPLTLGISFTDATGNKIHHQNYAIDITQDNTNVLSDLAGHTHTGDDVQVTTNLLSSDPIDIQITLKGVGLPNTDPSTWTGVKGETLSFTHIIPEFGPVASIVLAIAILSVVVFAAKTRVIPRL